MSVTEEMVTWLYLQYLVPQWRVSPMNAARLVENHNGRFMGYKNIHIMRNQFLRVVVGQPEELHPVDFATFVLKEIYVVR